MNCGYCKGKNCTFKDMVECKLKMKLDEASETESALARKIEEVLRLQDFIDEFRECFKPIIDVDLSKSIDGSALGVECINAIQEAQNYYREHIDDSI